MEKEEPGRDIIARSGQNSPFSVFLFLHTAYKFQEGPPDHTSWGYMPAHGLEGDETPDDSPPGCISWGRTHSPNGIQVAVKEEK